VKNVVEPQKVPKTFLTNKVHEERIVKMLRTIQVQEIKSSIDPDEWKKKLKLWRESTRTSPSGVHLGHDKSLLNGHGQRW